MRLAAGVFVLAHALITGAIWIPPQRGGDLKGFGAQASWLFADSRTVTVSFAVLAAAALALSGAGILTDQGWWPAFAVVGAVASLALITATFTPWWSAAVVINLALLYAAFQSMSAQQSGGLR
ncbi:MAG TPA: hypothetical protein VFU93_08555 [Acidimicrobiales bacterium]|nr:hypothetical protein [Acidimicrobiales bacterium]